MIWLILILLTSCNMQVEVDPKVRDVNTNTANGLTVVAPANQYYKFGDEITFTISSTQSLSLTGSPTLAVTLTSGSVNFAYDGASSTNTSLVFKHTVGASDLDLNGVTLGSLNLNGGSLKNQNNEDTDLTLDAPDLSGVLVDGLVPTLSSVTPPANGTYRSGDTIEFVLNSAEDLAVTGTPSLSVTIGALARTFSYHAASSTATALKFRYTIVDAENDSNGIALSTSITGTIKDLAGNDLSSTIPAPSVPNLTSVIVDTYPKITSVTPPANDTYMYSENLDFVVNYDQNVTVTGFPRISLVAGTTTRYATYQSGSGSQALTFRFAHTQGDTDANGIVLSSPIGLNGGTMTDTSTSANALLSFSLPITTGVLLDGTLPPIIEYYPGNSGSFYFISGIVSSPLVPTLTSGSAVTSYSELNLPSSANLNTTNGSITLDGGFESIVSNPTITATNAAGSSNNIALNLVLRDTLLLGQVSIGGNLTCAIMNKGGLYCSGAVLPDDATSADVMTLSTLFSHSVSKVSVGESTYCVIFASRLYCWGSNLSGENGANPADPVTLNPPANLVQTFSDGEENYGVTEVANGTYHTCLTKKNVTYCMGSNNANQLGSAGGNTYIPRPVDGNMGFKQLALGKYHSCGIDWENKLYCWGDNSADQIGNNGGPSSTPQLILSEIKQVTAYGYTTCALKYDGTVYCWGQDDNNMLGNGATGSVSTPSAVVTSKPIKKIYMGSNSVCGLDFQNDLECWGQITSSDSPTVFARQVTFFQLGHQDNFIMSDTSTGYSQLYVQGPNTFGQLGLGHSNPVSSLEAWSKVGINFEDMILGGGHTCLKNSMGYFCAGDKASGEYVTNAIDFPYLPVQEAIDFDYGALFAINGFHDTNGGFSCRTDKNSNLYCSGSDSAGQQGNGVGQTNNSSPSDLGLTNYYQRLVAGDNFVCYLTDTLDLWCFGAGIDSPTLIENNVWFVEAGGQYVAHGTSNPLVTRVKEINGALSADITGAIQKISVDQPGACVVTAMGSVECYSSSGEFHNMKGVAVPADPWATPLVLFDPDSNPNEFAHDVGVSETSVCFATNLKLYCMGYNSFGEVLGLHPGAVQPILQSVAGYFGFLRMKDQHACGFNYTDGKLQCWGNNASGQLMRPNHDFVLDNILPFVFQ
jgi:alpha-tubulin suppressor-like RCC1 family protein